MKESGNATIEYIQPKGKYIEVGKKVWIFILIVWWVMLYLISYSTVEVELQALAKEATVFMRKREELPRPEKEHFHLRYKMKKATKS